MKGTDTAVNKPSQTRPRLSFRNCGLFDNTSEGSGGAIFTIYTDIDVIDSIVRGNKASAGGAFYVENGALNIIRSNFTGNSVAPPLGFGGAVYALDTDVYMTDSIMDGNSAVGGEGRQGRGGVLFDKESTRGDTTLNSIRTRFTGNFATSVASSNPKVQQRGEGGAIFARKSASITFDSCTFDGNEAFRGGAIDIDERSLLNGALFKKTSFTNNVAISSGGAIYMTDGRTRFDRCNFFNNLSVRGQGGALYGVSTCI